MNRLVSLPKGDIAAAFITAGDPNAMNRDNQMADMLKTGANMLVVAIPFSDPTAESPEVQTASIRALECGITTDDVFKMIDDLRHRSDVPIVLYSYMNPVFYYGYEAFFRACEAAGVDGIILSDLPHEEMDEVTHIASGHGIVVIPVVATTSGERIPMLLSGAEGFVYAQGFADTDVLQDSMRAIRACCDLPVIASGYGDAVSKIADGILVTYTGTMV